LFAYRAASLAAAACLTGLSLAACSAGLTSVSPPSTSSAAPAAPTSGAPPASSASAASAPSTASTGTGVTGPGSTVTVGGSVGTFPIPPGAQVVESGTSSNQIEIVLSGVTPSALDSFYTSALPAAGYTITSNDQGTALGLGNAGINFTGHGYKGDIGDLNGTIGITLTPQ
jgi:hypothetical protein